jgi:hypothetical protein
MTEHNLFDEVQADLERQKLEALWKKYGIWIAVAALGIVLATAGSTAYRSWRVDRDQKLTSGLLDVSKTDADVAKGIDGLQKFADQNAGTVHADMALIRAGMLAVDKGDKVKAAGFFDKVANDAKADPAFRQLGELLSVQVQMDSGDAAALTARLQPLTEEREPWRYSALEAQGYLALRTHDTAKARQIFAELSQDARAPQSIAARAADILRSLN